MKIKDLYCIFILVISMIGVSSCDKDDKNSISPSETSVKMEGEGGDYSIKLNSDNWKIAEVVNKNGNSRISGNIYALDSTIIRENTTLELESLGILEAFWQDKGFSITRDEPDQLKIYLKPNATGEEFSFGIMLQNEIDTREIVVKQNISQGYTIDNIEYFLDEETDGDSLYWKVNLILRYNHSAPSPVSFATYGGGDITNTSYFESDDPYAFIWTKADSVEVEIPGSITGEGVQLADEKRVYGVISRIPFGRQDDMTTVEVREGKIQLEHSLEWRTRKVSYRLTLKSKRTKETITVDGKWYETTPTGGIKLQDVPYEEVFP